jgi:sulfatase modifying factor 1
MMRSLLVAVALMPALAVGPACTSQPVQRDGKPAAAAATSAVHSAGPPPIAQVNAGAPPGTAPEGMVWIPGGTFWMGCEHCAMPDALPVHLVTVAGFWMDRTPVTNAEFERFVRETRYITVAERPLDPEKYSGVPREKLVPGSAVFTPTSSPVPLDDPLQWWRYMPGANWKHPLGAKSNLKDRRNHPVVQVAYDDAVAYARWAKKRLPTEAEFEFAARGGLDRELYAWGNEMMPGRKAAANTWQGQFPVADRGDDGFRGTSPVTAFAPNGFGLYDVGGNVWQWCSDWYRPDTYAKRAQPAGAITDPQGPPDSFDPAEPGSPKRVVRGGSYLCTDQYCARYLVGSRGKGEVTSGTSNVGFRLVRAAR